MLFAFWLGLKEVINCVPYELSHTGILISSFKLILMPSLRILKEFFQDLDNAKRVIVRSGIHTSENCGFI